MMWSNNIKKVFIINIVCLENERLEKNIQELIGNNQQNVHNLKEAENEIG